MARNVILRFLGDSSNLDRTFRKVGSESDKFGAGVKKGFNLGAIGAAGAGVAFAKFGKDSIAAFNKAQQSQERLSDAFARFPALADVNINQLRRLNSQLASKTKFDDDATASGQAVLAGFKLTGAQIKTLTPLLQDYAAKTGKDLPTAATDFGKAMLGQGRALKAIGINFKDTGTTAGNFAELQDLVNQKVGGFAEREGKTAAGRAEILKNKFGELQEKVGSVLVPALTALTDSLIKIADWYNNLSPATQRLVQILGALAATFVAVTAAVKAFTIAEALLNVVLDANPVVLIALAIVALGAALVLAYQHSETFRKVVQFAFQYVKVQVDAVVVVVKTLIDLFKKAWDWAGKIVDKVKHLPVAGIIGKGLDLLGFAEGGLVPGAVGAPQLAVVHGGERVLTPAQQRNGGGSNTTVNIYMPPGSDGEDVVNAIQRYNRRNGKGWMSA